MEEEKTEVAEKKKLFTDIFILSTGEYVLDSFLTFGEAYDAMLKAERVEHRKVQITEATNSVYNNTVYSNVLSLTRRYKYHITDLTNYLTTTYHITKISVFHSKE